MLATFNALKDLYASREVTMDDLEVLQKYDFIRMENKGISRSNRDCLLCEVFCEPFAAFLDEATSSGFASVEAIHARIQSAGLALEQSPQEASDVLQFYSKDKRIEIFAEIGPDGSVQIDPDDVEAVPSFQVFLRVQH